jgi:transcriptional regulator with XRE-family HTH domain
LEAGRVANPGIQQLYKVAVALGVPLAQLVTDESSASTGVEHPVHDSSSYAEGIVPSQTNVELEELQSRIEELWRLDKGRFAALMVVVSDMQEKAVDVAERNDSEQKPHRAAHRPARR